MKKLIPMPMDESYALEPVCPYCGSKKLTRSVSPIVGEAEITVTIDCEDCGETHLAIFTLSGFDIE